MNTPIIAHDALVVNSDAEFILYGRESNRGYEDQLEAQMESLEFSVCWYTGKMMGLMLDTSNIIGRFSEVAKGWDFTRPEFRKAVKLGQESGAMIVLENLSRLVRHPTNHRAMPLSEQIDYLAGLRVTFILIEDRFSHTHSSMTLRGMRYGKYGAKPPTCRAKRKQIERYHEDGYTLGEISILTGIPKTTVHRYVRRMNQG